MQISTDEVYGDRALTSDQPVFGRYGHESFYRNYSLEAFFAILGIEDFGRRACIVLLQDFRLSRGGDPLQQQL